MLHNNEYHELSQMRKEFTKIVREFLANNETYQRIQGYIKLANDNLDKFHTAICLFNSNYKDYKLIKLSFVKASLLNSCLYEIELDFINHRGDRDSAKFGVDSLIIFLDRAGLLEDKLYYIQGKGFYSGYLSIEEDARIWGDYKQMFRKDEIDTLIKSIPNYIIYCVYDNDNKLIYNSED